MTKRPKACKENKRIRKNQIRKEKQARIAVTIKLGKSKDLILPSRGDHNCPHKDGSSIHRLQMHTCLTKKHVAYCSICGALCSYVYGCSRHHSEGAKGENLFLEESQELRAIVAENRGLGVFDPTRKLCITYEKGRVEKVVDMEMAADADTDDVGDDHVIEVERSPKRKSMSSVVFDKRE